LRGQKRTALRAGALAGDGPGTPSTGPVQRVVRRHISHNALYALPARQGRDTGQRGLAGGPSSPPGTVDLALTRPEETRHRAVALGRVPPAEGYDSRRAAAARRCWVTAAFAGHSLRAGLITAAAGVPTHVIQRQSGHTALGVLYGYVREGEPPTSTVPLSCAQPSPLVQ
jgi:hypothetical protein